MTSSLSSEPSTACVTCHFAPTPIGSVGSSGHAGHSGSSWASTCAVPACGFSTCSLRSPGTPLASSVLASCQALHGRDRLLELIELRGGRLAAVVVHVGAGDRERERRGAAGLDRGDLGVALQHDARIRRVQVAAELLGRALMLGEVERELDLLLRARFRRQLERRALALARGHELHRRLGRRHARVERRQLGAAAWPARAWSAAARRACPLRAADPGGSGVVGGFGLPPHATAAATKTTTGKRMAVTLPHEERPRTLTAVARALHPVHPCAAGYRSEPSSSKAASTSASGHRPAGNSRSCSRARSIAASCPPSATPAAISRLHVPGLVRRRALPVSPRRRARAARRSRVALPARRAVRAVRRSSIRPRMRGRDGGWRGHHRARSARSSTSCTSARSRREGTWAAAERAPAVPRRARRHDDRDDAGQRVRRHARLGLRRRESVRADPQLRHARRPARVRRPRARARARRDPRRRLQPPRAGRQLAVPRSRPYRLEGGKPNEWGDALDYRQSAACANSSSRTPATGSTSFTSTACGSTRRRRSTTTREPHILAELVRRARAAAGTRRIFIVAENEPQDTALLTSTASTRCGTTTSSTRRASR